jgi:hypothetical protein
MAGASAATQQWQLGSSASSASVAVLKIDAGNSCAATPKAAAAAAAAAAGWVRWRYLLQL